MPTQLLADEHPDKPPEVLLVDDDEVNLLLTSIALRERGFEITEAGSGEQAIAILGDWLPDVVVLDALMPGLDGFETCRRIKAEPAWSHVPVIFMTGLSQTAEVLRGFDAGGVDYVVKPVRAQEVLARLATHVRNARTARMARAAVDVGGHGVLLIDAQQRVAWQSPQAQQWLAEFCTPPGGTPDLAWLGDPADGGGSDVRDGEAASTTPRSITRDGRVLTALQVGSVGLGEVMWLLSARPAQAAEETSRLAAAALTAREAEVLSWIAKGKTNRDIGDILGISSRTVNKHLEHVFEKLGVETRAAAAALAIRGA